MSCDPEDQRVVNGEVLPPLKDGFTLAKLRQAVAMLDRDRRALASMGDVGKWNVIRKAEAIKARQRAVVSSVLASAALHVPFRDFLGSTTAARAIARAQLFPSKEGSHDVGAHSIAS